MRILFFLLLSVAAQAQTHPLLMEGKQSLYQRVIARPGATLSPTADGQHAQPVPGFTVFYVYTAGPRLQVGRSADGHIEGWIEAEKAIPWKHTMVAAFTNPAGRQPVLFLGDAASERGLINDEHAGARADTLRTAAQAGTPGPVLAVEPARVVDFARNFYLMPILSAERVERDAGPARLLEVISAPAEPPPPPPPAPFKAGLVFVLDTTMSMQPYIDRTRDAIRGIVASIGQTPVRDNFRFGLVAYRDSLLDGAGLEYATKVYGKPDFALPPETINTGIAAARQSDTSSLGFDEDPIGGIKAALDEIDWGPLEGGRYIVLITDAGARPATHPHSVTHLNIADIRVLAKARGVAVIAIHLLTPEGRAVHDHEPAAAQYRELTRDNGAGSLYFPVPGGSPEAFATTVQALTRTILAQVGEATGHPVAGGPAPPAMQQAIRVVSEAMRLTYLGRTENTRAPDVLRSWTTDRDLKDPSIGSLDVRVLLTRNQLSDLAHSLQGILDAGLAGRTEPRQFFSQLRSTFAAAARDPQRIAGASKIGAMLGEYLDDLPYQSEIMDIQEPDWLAMGAIAQRTVLNNIEAKLRLYQEFQSNLDLWVDLSGTRSPGEALFPVPIEALP